MLTDNEKLSLAKKIAHDYGYFVVNMGRCGNPEYCLYKVNMPHATNTFICRRMSANAILSHVKKVTGYR